MIGAALLLTALVIGGIYAASVTASQAAHFPLLTPPIDPAQPEPKRSYHYFHPMNGGLATYTNVQIPRAVSRTWRYGSFSIEHAPPAAAGAAREPLVMLIRVGEGKTFTRDRGWGFVGGPVLLSMWVRTSPTSAITVTAAQWWLLALAAPCVLAGGGLTWSGLLPWRRSRRGRCPACGYNRSGLSPATPCPECGLARHIPAKP